jgi:hypothetical protein
MGGNPQNGMKRSHRIEPAIEPEHVFVEVRLQMLWLDTAVMSPLKPGLQVAENKVDHWQVRLSFVRVASKRQHIMAVSCLRESRVASPSVCTHDGTGDDVLFDKSGERFGAPIGNDAKPQPSRINTASVFLAIILARSNLDCSNDERLMMNAAPFAARLATNEAFVDLDGMLAADGIPFGTDHTSAQLVENLKGRLVTAKSKLALELNGRLPRNLCSHQVGAPKPRREGRVTRLHDRSGCQRGVGLTATATKHDRRARCETVWLPDKPALWTRKPVRPTHGFEVVSARRVVGEYPLKLRERSGEAANVHSRNTSRLLRPCQATG